MLGTAGPSLVPGAWTPTMPFSPVPVTLMGTGASFDLIDSVHASRSWRCRPAMLNDQAMPGLLRSRVEPGLLTVLFSFHLHYLGWAGVQVWRQCHGHHTHLLVPGISESHQEGNSVCIHFTQPADMFGLQALSYFTISHQEGTAIWST